MAVPQKVKNRLFYDPAISLMDIYPKNIKALIQMDTPMFKSALFTIANIGKQTLTY